MKLGVISDSHDNLHKLEAGVSVLCAHDLAMVVHAGDFIAPFTARYFASLPDLGIPFAGVFGNNDGEKFGLRKMYEPIGPIHEDKFEVELGGRRIIVVHKELLVEPLARSGDYDLVVYGHTHRIDVRTDPCLIVNPGEAGGWTTGKSTLAIVDLADLSATIEEF
ncbi:YfcE family phosphodiesterase [Candidatus Poribacteria bacterium]|nr:YfcE family phosphodiesterase [Candidatus Poribacteria bacterium]